MISNLPRNIHLDKNKKTFLTKNEYNLLRKIKSSKKKIYGYFPTWREDGLEIFRDIKNLEKLDDLDLALKRSNSIILLKKHRILKKKMVIEDIILKLKMILKLKI